MFATAVIVEILLEAEDQREDHDHDPRPHQINRQIRRLPPLQGREADASGEEAGIEHA